MTHGDLRTLLKEDGPSSLKEQSQAKLHLDIDDLKQQSEQEISKGKLFLNLLLAPTPLAVLFAATSSGLNLLVVLMPVLVALVTVASSQFAANGPMVTIAAETIQDAKESLSPRTRKLSLVTQCFCSKLLHRPA